MTPDTVFNICNTLALMGWIILLVFPFWHSSDSFLIGILITLFALVYCWLIFSHFKIDDLSKFGSLGGVMELFKDPAMVAAGWIHYLAFDLMTGIFIKKNALKHGISHGLVIPCLLLTFLFGPIGLLLYLLIRLLATRHYFASNY